MGNLWTTLNIVRLNKFLPIAPFQIFSKIIFVKNSFKNPLEEENIENADK